MTSHALAVRPDWNGGGCGGDLPDGVHLAGDDKRWCVEAAGADACRERGISSGACLT
jgi:hypothetical protein